MISILLCDRDKQEIQMIQQDCKKQVEQNSDESLQTETVADCSALSKAAENGKLVDLLYYEFQKGQGIDDLRAFRRHCSDAMAMYIADAVVSPLEYLRPGIAPDALILRPVTMKQLSTINAEFMASFFERFKNKDVNDSFVVDTREEKVFIPFPYIYYFEARDKKLFVRTKNEEYAFYDTIEALEKRLPENFQRCHRSYIVNTSMIIRISASESYIELSDQIGVPISRSYKTRFKGVRT